MHVIACITRWRGLTNTIRRGLGGVGTKAVLAIGRFWFDDLSGLANAEGGNTRSHETSSGSHNDDDDDRSKGDCSW